MERVRDEKNSKSNLPPEGRGTGRQPNDAAPLRTASSKPVRKLRAGALVGLGAPVLLPRINAAPRKLGLPAIGLEDIQAAWDLGVAAYGSVAAVVAWVAAYLARPEADDAPVRDHRAGARSRRVGW